MVWTTESKSKIGRVKTVMKNLDKNAQGVDLAIIRRILANNPEQERLIKLAQQLRQQYRSGLLSLPADADLSGMDAETAEIAAAFLLAIRGAKA